MTIITMQVRHKAELNQLPDPHLLRLIREQAGVSQEAVARAVGDSVGSLQMGERFTPSRSEDPAPLPPRSRPAHEGHVVILDDLGPTMTVGQAAELLGVSRNSAYDGVRRGEIPSLRVGKRVLIPTAKLLAVLGLTLHGCPVAEAAQQQPSTATEIAEDNPATESRSQDHRARRSRRPRA